MAGKFFHYKYFASVNDTALRLSLNQAIYGVPGAVSDSFDNYKAAYTLYAAAFEQGQVQRVVQLGGIYDNDTPFPTQRRSISAESSLWEMVSDINDAAAHWTG
jgi:hypothetical protein